MADKVVTYCSTNRLSCANCLPAEVILCLKTDDIVKPLTCPGSEVDAETASTTVEATLSAVSKSCGGCNTSVWKYSFTYNDEDLIDVGRTINSDDIAGVFCQGCLITWAKEKIGSEVYLRDNEDGTLTLVSQHGCEYTFSGSLV